MLQQIALLVREFAAKKLVAQNDSVKPAMTKASPQECVGTHRDKRIAPSGSKRVQVRCKRAKLMVVCGCRWSLSIYRNTRLAGWGMGRTWTEAFVE